MTLIIYLLGALAIGPTVTAKTISLRDAIYSTLNHNEDIGIQKTRQSQAWAYRALAKGAFYPNLSASAQYLIQDESQGTRGAGSAFGSARRRDQTQSNITFNQPLFHGFKNYAEFQWADFNLKKNQALNEAEKIKAIQKTVSQYYRILAQQTDLDHLDQSLKLTQQSVEQIQSRAQIGKSKDSEALAAQTEAALLEFQIKQAQSKLSDLRNEFMLVTGLEITPEDQLEKKFLVAKEGVGSDVPVVTLKPLAYYLEKTKMRQDVQASQWGLEASDRRIIVARSGHFPTLDMTAHYYFQRAGILDDLRWDASLNLTIPIFSGGAVRAQTKEAIERKAEAELQLRKTIRNAELEIRTYYQQALVLQGSLSILRRASQLAQKSFKAHKKDYDFGLITHLEVLKALDSKISTLRKLDEVFYQLEILVVSLIASVGDLEEVNLGAI